MLRSNFNLHITIFFTFWTLIILPTDSSCIGENNYFKGKDWPAWLCLRFFFFPPNCRLWQWHYTSMFLSLCLISSLKAHLRSWGEKRIQLQWRLLLEQQNISIKEKIKAMIWDRWEHLQIISTNLISFSHSAVISFCCISWLVMLWWQTLWSCLIL